MSGVALSWAGCVLLASLPSPAHPHEAPAGPRRAGDVARFFGGAAVGLAAHETAHLAFDLAWGAHPGIEKVDFAGIPFFAITHDPGLPPRREFTISSAGFWTQHAGSEWILTRRPRLRGQRAPFTKGVLAFDLLASVAYAGAAFARAGPEERDTRGMGQSLGLGEAGVGALVLAPALLDGYRYVRPEARWAKWASRSLKAGMILLVLKAPSRP